MSPSSFTFELTVPNDPEGVTVVTAVTAHAVEYANLDAGVGAAFVERVRQVPARHPDRRPDTVAWPCSRPPTAI